MADAPPSLPSATIPVSGLVGQIRKSDSFAAIVRDPSLQPRFPPLQIPSKIISVKSGKPAVSFSVAEVEASTKRFAHTLVAKFTIGRPSIQEIQLALQSAWRFEGRTTLSEIWDGRHILIILDSENDVVAALSNPIRKIGNSLFRLFRWQLDYDPRRESTTTTDWFRLPDLPIPLYDNSFIEVIVSSFGIFLDVDDRTKVCLSMTYARIYLEIDVSKPIPDSVWVNLSNNKGYWQKVIKESNLAYC